MVNSNPEYFQYHVVPILTIFAISGSILAMVELLGVVLACCLANVLIEENRIRKIREQEDDQRECLRKIAEDLMQA